MLICVCVCIPIYVRIYLYTHIDMMLVVVEAYAKLHRPFKVSKGQQACTCYSTEFQTPGPQTVCKSMVFLARVRGGALSSHLTYYCPLQRASLGVVHWPALVADDLPVISCSFLGHAARPAGSTLPNRGSSVWNPHLLWYACTPTTQQKTHMGLIPGRLRPF